ncbi:hypothetical protein C6W84_3185 [Acinetobacter baumannii]|nr:hypothetical protein C6W84_3185 [Acinetobacter baumannii]
MKKVLPVMTVPTVSPRVIFFSADCLLGAVDI